MNRSFLYNIEIVFSVLTCLIEALTTKQQIAQLVLLINNDIGGVFGLYLNWVRTFEHFSFI